MTQNLTEIAPPRRKYGLPLKGFDHVCKTGETQLSITKQVDASEPFFAGHYPDFPIYPGVFIIETVYQGLRHYYFEQGYEIRLAEVISTRFIKPVLPGDLLENDCELIQDENIDSQFQVNATCFCSGTKVSELKFLFEIE